MFIDYLNVFAMPAVFLLISKFYGPFDTKNTKRPEPSFPIVSCLARRNDFK